ncbi:MAG: alpha/beta fold hydrolase [Polyangiales bacterium]
MWMLLHGFSGSPRSWDEVVARAQLDPDPLRPALAGHGSDWRLVGTRAFDDEVSRLNAMAFGLGRPRLICGYSMGARVALGMLVSRPELWDGALLIGAHPGLAYELARAERRASDGVSARMLRTEGLVPFVNAWEQLPLFRSQRELSGPALATQRSIRLGHDAEGLAHALDVLGLAEMPNYGAMLSSFSGPITLMAGACDAKFSGIAGAIARDNSNVDAVLVEGVGHNVVLEAPGTVAAALNRFQSKVSE